MTTENGYARIYRCLYDHPVFRSHHEAAVFAWMVTAARWKTGMYRTNCGPIRMEAGDLLIQEREMADQWHMTRHAIRAVLERMVEHGMINLIRNHKDNRVGTIVRIVNYSAYQPVVIDPDPVCPHRAWAEPKN